MLIGDDLRNHLNGGEGRDVVQGRDGADSVDGGPGRDRVRAGGGDDLLLDSAFYDAADRNVFACGEGNDEVVAPTARDRVASDCEGVTPDGDITSNERPTLALKLPLRGASAPVARLRQAFCVDVRCTVTLELRLAQKVHGVPDGTVLGRRRIVLAYEERVENLTVRLSQRGRRLLVRARRLPVRIRLARGPMRGVESFEVRLLSGLPAP